LAGPWGRGVIPILHINSLNYRWFDKRTTNGKRLAHSPVALTDFEEVRKAWAGLVKYQNTFKVLAHLQPWLAEDINNSHLGVFFGHVISDALLGSLDVKSSIA